MSASPFAPSILGGAWAHRVAPRRAWIDALPWDEAAPPDSLAERWAWTQTTYSEYAAAASFAAITSALLAAGAPVDLVAVAGDFVVDELTHVEVSARIAAHLGGGVSLEVDMEKLVRPPMSADPALRAAELIVRVCCVGEAMTVPLLEHGRRRSRSCLVAEALRKILKDEVPHAQLGGWFMTWADAWLDDSARAHLGRVAGAALRSFAPLMASQDEEEASHARPGPTFRETFARAASQRVARPLTRWGIDVPEADLRALGSMHTV